MKFCSYCGKEYADTAARCEVDRQPLIGWEDWRKETPPPAGLTAQAFTARLVAPIGSSGSYRVYLRGSDLYFIRLDGGTLGGWIEPFLFYLGPLGGLVHVLLWAGAWRKARHSLERFDQADPADLLREHDGNFKVYLLEIQDAVLAAPSFLAASSKPTGRLRLSLRNGKTLKLEFEEADAIKTALYLLRQRLGSTLRVEGEWNEQRQQFRKKKGD